MADHHKRFDGIDSRAGLDTLLGPSSTEKGRMRRAFLFCSLVLEAVRSDLHYDSRRSCQPTFCRLPKGGCVSSDGAGRGVTGQRKTLFQVGNNGKSNDAG